MSSIMTVLLPLKSRVVEVIFQNGKVKQRTGARNQLSTTLGDDPKALQGLLQYE